MPDTAHTWEYIADPEGKPPIPAESLDEIAVFADDGLLTSATFTADDGTLIASLSANKFGDTMAAVLVEADGTINWIQRTEGNPI